MKYPMLVVGIALFVIYLSMPETKRFWEKHFNRFVPNTCSAILDRIAKKAPTNWSLECPGTVRLVVDIQSEIIPNQKNLRQGLYKELANNLLKLSQISNLETLENLKVIEMNLMSSQKNIHAKTDGEALVELSKKRSQKAIAQHLKLTVKVKED